MHNKIIMILNNNNIIIILLFHHVSISAEHPYKSIQDNMTEFLKHNKIINYDNIVSTVNQKDAPV